MEDRGGEARVVAVQLPLAGAVGVHLEQGLYSHLPAVVVVPAGVEHPSVIGQRGESGVHLVEAESPHVAAVAVAGEQVAHLGPPAIDRLDAAGGAEDDVAVGHVDGLVIGVAQPRGKLPHLPGLFLRRRQSTGHYDDILLKVYEFAAVDDVLRREQDRMAALIFQQQIVVVPGGLPAPEEKVKKVRQLTD